MKKIPDVFEFAGIKNASYEDTMTIRQLAEQTANNSAIVGVKGAQPGAGLHAIVVDGVEDGMVKIRDPWSIGNGPAQSYSIKEADFLKDWNRGNSIGIIFGGN